MPGLVLPQRRESAVGDKAGAMKYSCAPESCGEEFDSGQNGAKKGKFLFGAVAWDETGQVLLDARP